MTKRATVRHLDDLIHKAEVVAPANDTDANHLIIDSIAIETDRVHASSDFMNRVKQIVERDKEILDELAK